MSGSFLMRFSMSLQKICMHAALSLALVSSATSQAMSEKIPKPVLVGGGILFAGIVLGGAARVVYNAGFLHGVKSVDQETKNMKQDLQDFTAMKEDFTAMKEAFNPQGGENLQNPSKPYLSNWVVCYAISALQAQSTKLTKDLSERNIERGFQFPLDKKGQINK
jgi:hypothetical protein